MHPTVVWPAVSGVLIFAGAVILILGNMIAGHRLHAWLYNRIPQVGGRVPRDAGAWLGLCVGLLAAYSAFFG